MAQATMNEQSVVLIDASAIVALHDMAILADGGLPGMRDPGAFESAVAKIGNYLAYEAADLSSCAAALAFGLAKNHPFNDANKRTAYLAMDSFLRVNGFKIVAPEDEQVEQMVGLAESSVSQEQMGQWIKSHAKPLDPPSPRERLSGFRARKHESARPAERDEKCHHPAGAH